MNVEIVEVPFSLIALDPYIHARGGNRIQRGSNAFTPQIPSDTQKISNADTNTCHIQIQINVLYKYKEGQMFSHHKFLQIHNRHPDMQKA